MKNYILIICYCFASMCAAYSQDPQKDINAIDMGSQKINFDHLRQLSQTYPGCYGMLKDQIEGLADMNPEAVAKLLRQLHANAQVKIDSNPKGDELSSLRLLYAIESYNTLKYFVNEKTDMELEAAEGEIRLAASRAESLKLLEKAETVFRTLGISEEDISSFNAHLSSNRPSE